MRAPVRIEEVAGRRDLLDFVRFPWRVYRGDKNWVPPLIPERLDRLNPESNPFFDHADVRLLRARSGRETLGTMAVFVDHLRLQHFQDGMGGFGFFEVVEDFEVARALLDAGRERLLAWGMEGVIGPTNFGINDEPGVLLEGADAPAALLEAHSPPYYAPFLERYGMVKRFDNFAWRVDLGKLESILARLPEQFHRVLAAAEGRPEVRIRKLRMGDWEQEAALTLRLYNAAHVTSPEHVPMPKEVFDRFARQLRPLLDPDLVRFAEVDGEPVGYLVAIPDFNTVLLHLNGRLLPVGWLKALWYRRRIDRVSFKLLGVLPRYRRQGIDLLLYFDAVREAARKGYCWLDGSLTADHNPVVWRLAERMGAERYKHYRIYQMRFAAD